MLKKTLITTLALGIVVSSSAIISGAEGKPIYTDDGELILDTPQAPYVDQSNLENDSNLDSGLDSSVKPEEQTKAIQQPIANVNPSVNGGTGQSNSIQSSGQVTTKAFSQPAVANLATVASVSASASSEILLGTLAPSSSNYVIGSNATVSTKANKSIKKVEALSGNPLSTAAFSHQGNTVTFKSSELNKLEQGSYSIKVTFTDNDTAVYELRVIKQAPPASYWQQNIDTFNKDIKSSNHKDLMLISSDPNVEVLDITYNGIHIPKTAYTVVSGNVIISQSFLMTQPESEYDSIIVTDGNKTQTHFNLKIIDEEEQPRTSQMVNC